MARDDLKGEIGQWSLLLYTGVLATAVWAPIPFGSTESWSIGLIRLSVLALVALWVIASAKYGVLIVNRSWIQIPLYAAAAFAFIQTLPLANGDPVTADVYSSRQAGFTILTVAIFFSLALLVLDGRDRLARTVQVIFWLGFAVSVLAILQRLSGTDSIYWIRQTKTNFVGPYANRNHFAGLMELLTPTGLGLMLTGAIPSERRALVAFGVLVMCVAIVFSGSRGGMLSLAAEMLFLGLMAYATRSRREKGRSRLALAGGVLALVIGVGIGVAWIGTGPVVESVSSLPDDIQSTDPISRNGIWKNTLRLIADHPGVGTGIGAYATSFTAYTASSGRAVVAQAHNDYLQVLADAGTLGAILAILFIVGLVTYTMKGIRRKDRTLRGVALGASAGCFGLLVHSLFDFNLQILANAILFVLLVACVVRATEVTEVAYLQRIVTKERANE